jgi:uncharacterized damage-inducible protein DinB
MTVYSIIVSNFCFKQLSIHFFTPIFSVFPMITDRPLPAHYAHFYAGYLAQVPEGADVPHLLRQLQASTADRLASIGEERAGTAYAPGKWTIKEMVGHCIDTERIFAYRALRLYRGDATPLPGFDQDPYVASSHANARPLAALAREWYAVREATVQLVASFDRPDQLDFVGQCSGGPMTARAMTFVIAGHELHHLGVLRERYGV